MNHPKLKYPGRTIVLNGEKYLPVKINISQVELDEIKRIKEQSQNVFILIKGMEINLIDLFNSLNYFNEETFRWNSANPENLFAGRKKHLFARVFLYSTDNVFKLMQKMTTLAYLDSKLKNGIEKILLEFNNSFVGLKDNRDTSHHLEDRILKKNKRDQEIQLKPVNTIGINAPDGALILDNLQGNNYGNTSGEGEFVQIEISEKSLVKINQLIQDVINLFEWEGFEHNFPY